MNSKAKGEISEGAVLAHLLKKGKIVLLPFGNNQRYDLVIHEPNGNFSRIQVKTGCVRNGCVRFYPFSTNGFTGQKKSYKGEIDFFIVYCAELEKFYQIHVDELNKSGLLRVNKPKGFSSPKSTIRWAEKYEI
jgi:hypothetical protein